MAKMDEKLLGLAAIGSAAAGLVYYFKKSKKMWMKISTMILKMKTSILTMIFNRSTGDNVDLNAGKASPEEADDAEETETMKILWMRMLTKWKED